MYLKTYFVREKFIIPPDINAIFVKLKLLNSIYEKYTAINFSYINQSIVLCQKNYQ